MRLNTWDLLYCTVLFIAQKVNSTALHQFNTWRLTCSSDSKAHELNWTVSDFHIMSPYYSTTSYYCPMEKLEAGIQADTDMILDTQFSRYRGTSMHSCGSVTFVTTWWRNMWVYPRQPPTHRQRLTGRTKKCNDHYTKLLDIGFYEWNRKIRWSISGHYEQACKSCARRT